MKVMLVTLCGCTRRMEVNDGYNVIACGLGDAGEPGNKHGTPVRFFGRTTEVSKDNMQHLRTPAQATRRSLRRKPFCLPVFSCAGVFFRS